MTVGSRAPWNSQSLGPVSGPSCVNQPPWMLGDNPLHMVLLLPTPQGGEQGQADVRPVVK